jgi:dTMP kinase
MNRSESNRMIVIDGVDGAGKGVQSRRLLGSFERAGMAALLTREPGGSPAAEEIRELLVNGEPEKWDDMSELLLMYAARRAHLRDTVWPALASGQWVISDRYADSSRAFQGIAGNLGLECVEAVHRIAIGDFEPALVIILDVSEALALERAAARGTGGDRFEKKGTAYQARVREAFLSIAASDTDRYQVVAADQSMDRVSEAIIDIVNRRFELALVADTESV